MADDHHHDVVTTLTTDHLPNFRRIAGTSLFRSAKLDSISEAGVKLLDEINIKCVFDLRSPEGWEDPSSTADVLDANYQTFTVKAASWRQSLSDGAAAGHRSLVYQPLPGRSSNPVRKDHRASHDTLPTRRHIYLNIIDKEFALGLLKNVVPWYAKPWICILMISFLLTRTKYFLRAFAYYAMNPIGIKGQYQGVLTYCGDAIHAALLLLSEPTNVPAIVCCAQGKDRTGILAALLSSVCGVERDDIIRDYAASAEHIAKMSEEIQYYTDQYYLKREFGSADAETMASLLDFVDERYGSVSKYLESIGFSQDHQDRLKETISLQRA